MEKLVKKIPSAKTVARRERLQLKKSEAETLAHLRRAYSPRKVLEEIIYEVPSRTVKVNVGVDFISESEEVISRKLVPCIRKYFEKMCKKHFVDPFEKKGWEIEVYDVCYSWDTTLARPTAARWKVFFRITPVDSDSDSDSSSSSSY